ncbi:MAG: gamma-glutamyl-gamma-aminobutyrate hydrolase family protein [Pseudomonadales bacterium]|nr:gamma-glutamyl-gamma-aminobutyrate hydrolase family protein [Pseudomonadales bacterium]MCP5184282.1 gamma-glutamyl-gamma-aminobutyrate hydrolase family protein [Pseudomonadales bacterium]
MNHKVKKPLVLVPCDVKAIPGGGPFHCAGEKYLDAVIHGADCMALLLPALGGGEEMASFQAHYDLDELLDLAQGVYLPGSASNIDPVHYGGPPHDMALDGQRDVSVFPLIRKTLAHRKPLLAICRGLQELNVALGGTLHARVHDIPGHGDHREDSSAPREEQYGDAHAVALEPGGVLARITGNTRLTVNSLHSQGIATLADGLRVEATAEDGLIEAVSMTDPWVVGVQWHPEWRYRQNPDAIRLFAAFGDALRGA